MNANVQQTLKVVRALLEGGQDGGSRAALSVLERAAREHGDVNESSIIWACICDLRERLGQADARQAAERASLLRCAPVRTLSFDENESLHQQVGQGPAHMYTPFSSSRSRRMSGSVAGSPWGRRGAWESPGWMKVRTSRPFETEGGDAQDALRKASELGQRCKMLLGDAAMRHATGVGAGADMDMDMDKDKDKGKEKCRVALLQSGRIGKCTGQLLRQG